MNEPLFACQICRELDEAAGRLPARITERLERSRRLAVERAGSLQVAGLNERSGIFSTGTARYGLIGSLGQPQRRRPLLPRWALAALVPILVGASMLGVVRLHDPADEVDDSADLEAAVLVDDVPIATYADRGFGVFLANNVRQVRFDARQP